MSQHLERSVRVAGAQQSGQIGIIIVLIMVVLLTIGLSLASRSTREVALSQQEEESTRVFNAAEAGVEQALSTDLNFQGESLHPAPTSIPGSNATIDYSIDKSHVLETRLFQGVVAKVQLRDAGVSTPASISIDWSKETDCNAAAAQKPASLVVSIYSSDNASPPTISVRHLAFAACDRGDGITVAGGGSNGYYRRATIALQSADLFLRLRPVYNDTQLLVTPSSGSLPVQAYDIRSSATNDSGQENRIVRVNRTLSTAPSIFDFVVYSGTTLTK